MTVALSPSRWANDLTRLLDSVYANGVGRFPVRVADLAREFSKQRFPNDPVSLIKGASLSGFDGALHKAPPGKIGWGIIYNDAITAKGRINFTLAHEFGHYLLHRLAYPTGFNCSQAEIAQGNDAHRKVEQQANAFAAGLLMPLNDFRAQLPAKSRPTFEELGACAERYGTSLIATTLRWLDYAERRSLLVVARDGYVLWARASKEALRTGIYFKTAGRPPIPVPASSLAAGGFDATARAIVDHDDGVWFDEACREVAVASDQYDFTVSLLHCDDAAWRKAAYEDEAEADTLTFMAGR